MKKSISITLLAIGLITLFPPREFVGSTTAINGRSTPSRVFLFSGNIIHRYETAIDYRRILLEWIAIASIVMPTGMHIGYKWKKSGKPE